MGVSLLPPQRLPIFIMPHYKLHFSSCILGIENKCTNPLKIRSLTKTLYGRYQSRAHIYTCIIKLSKNGIYKGCADTAYLQDCKNDSHVQRAHPC